MKRPTIRQMDTALNVLMWLSEERVGEAHSHTQA